MARITLLSTTKFFGFSFLFFFIANSVSGKNLGLKKEKRSHFRFYWHDVLTGPKPTSVTVVPPYYKNTSVVTGTGFGLIQMFDAPLTNGPNLDSKLLGRGQGYYAVASQSEASLFMSMNVVFVEGKYNGSMFVVQGRNSVLYEVREMAVLGGSGLFRFARGYVTLTTNMYDVKSGNAAVEYNAYVLHY